jgi:hypothetical protein
MSRAADRKTSATKPARRPARKPATADTHTAGIDTPPAPPVRVMIAGAWQTPVLSRAERGGLADRVETWLLSDGLVQHGSPDRLAEVLADADAPFVWVPWEAAARPLASSPPWPRRRGCRRC